MGHMGYILSRQVNQFILEEPCAEAAGGKILSGKAMIMELGSTVHIKYVGTLEDGTEFGSATEEKPLVFQTGMEMIIPGFEKEILEMNEVGEKKKFVVDQHDAYGEYLAEYTQKIPRDNIPVRDLYPGKRVWVYDDSGQQIPLTVISVGDRNVEFDLNHPLAGHDLTFEVEIVKIEDAPENFVSAEERRRRMERLGGNGGGVTDSFGTTSL
jgi:peptidylprolyl isomerase